MEQSMSMFETTRYINNTNKKRVINLIVPTHLTEYTIKLPETLRLDKVTDVYLDGVTDMAGETTECFEEPMDQIQMGLLYRLRKIIEIMEWMVIKKIILN